MTRPGYQSIACRSALNRAPGNMPFRWSLNPYRGCQHRCVYCFARRYHGYLDLDMGRDFEELILAKTNLPSVLRRALGRPSARGEPITIGTATDPYQTAEGTYRLTRRCLEVLAETATPGSLTTKGTLVVRDVDLLQHLAREVGFRVNLSLITLDRRLGRQLEPGAPPPESRLRALERLAAAGVPVAVLMVPVLPGLTDRPAQLAEVVRAAAEHGADEVWPGALRLAPSVKEWFLDFLRREHPRLVPAYERGYRLGRDAPKAYRDRLERSVAALKAGHPFGLSGRRLEPPARVGRQYVLPL